VSVSLLPAVSVTVRSNVTTVSSLTLGASNAGVAVSPSVSGPTSGPAVCSHA
jgi:hypothetical protein